jgi:hypothetical protein
MTENSKTQRHKGTKARGQEISIRAPLCLCVSVSLCFLTYVTVFPKSSALAQTDSTAQISGVVKDASGAVLAGAEVTVTQIETGLTRTASTNESGFYALRNLPVGPYRLEAVLPSFRSHVQTGIVLQVNSNPVLDVTLELGPVTQTVEVQANAPLVELRTTGISSVVDNQRILDLPLNGRQPTDLIVLAGAALPMSAVAPAAKMLTGVSIAVAGGLSYGVAYALDGASHNNYYDATGMPLPFPDALAEFRVAASTQDAQQGVHSGAAVNGVTKSGTNQLHGNLFEFVRNGKFNARNFFAAQRDSLKRHQFGGTIGGPIKKDRLFFFAGYQRTTLRSDPSQLTTVVPTAAMLAGDFTFFTSAQCQNTPVRLREPFVNNRVSESQLSPAALRIASYFPPASDPCGRIQTGTPTVQDQAQYVGRIDYQVNSKHSVLGRYVGLAIDSVIPYTLNKNVLSTSVGGQDDLATSIALGHTYVISNRTMNSFRVSLNRVAGNHQGASFFGPSDVGINAYSYVPHFINVSIQGGPTIGGGVASGNSIFITMSGANNDISVVRGTHQLAFGGNITHSLVNGLNTAFSTGNYGFNGSTTGLGWADFLTGNVSQLRQSAPSSLIESHWLMGLYAQDTWRATPRLTLNYGLRWEPFFPMQIKDGKIYNFSLDRFNQGIVSRVYKNAPAGLYYPGDPGFNGKASLEKHWWNLQPRIGLTWDPLGDGRTAIRVGGGIGHEFVSEQMVHNMTSVAPFSGDTLVNGPIRLDDPWQGFPGGNPFPYSSDPATARFTAGGSFMPMPPSLKPTSVYSWNLGVQRQVTPNLFASASYAGSRTIHMWALRELNPAVFLGLNPCTLNTATGPVFYSVCSTMNNTPQRRRLSLQNPVAAQNIGNVSQWDDGGTQDYHGLLVNTTLRAGGSINVTANYTWSHCIGDLSLGHAIPTAPFVYPHVDNRRLDRGPCQGGLADRRHIFNLTSVLRTPRFSNPVVRRLGSDWTLSTIYRYQSGAPLSIGVGTDRALMGISAGVQRAAQTLPNVYAAVKGTACPNTPNCVSWLNPLAFAAPALGTLSDLGVGTVGGPAFWRLDTALARSFSIHEQHRLEVRAEAFNVLNGVRLFNPVSIVGDPQFFGAIIGAQDPRIMQFALKYVF